MHLRSNVATALYAMAVLILVGVTWAALRGGVALEWQGSTFHLWTFWPLRTSAILAALGAIVDPLRRERWARLVGFIEARWSVVAVSVSALVLTYLIGFKLSQYSALQLSAYDLTLFESTLHNTLHGSFMHAFGLNRSLFSEHFEPVMLALLPLYALIPSALTLMLVEAVVVAAACVPLYAVCRGHQLSRPFSLLVVMGFLWNEVVWRSVTVDFHVELFTPLAVFTMYAAAQRQKWALFFVSVLGALTIKEELAFVCLPFSAFLVFSKKPQWARGIVLAAVSAVWAVVSFKFIIPQAHPTPGIENPLLFRWGHLGNTIPEVAWGSSLDRCTSFRSWSALRA